MASAIEALQQKHAAGNPLSGNKRAIAGDAEGSDDPQAVLFEGGLEQGIWDGQYMYYCGGHRVPLDEGRWQLTLRFSAHEGHVKVVIVAMKASIEQIHNMLVDRTLRRVTVTPQQQSVDDSTGIAQVQSITLAHIIVPDGSDTIDFVPSVND